MNDLRASFKRRDAVRIDIRNDRSLGFRLAAASFIGHVDTHALTRREARTLADELDCDLSAKGLR